MLRIKEDSSTGKIPDFGFIRSDATTGTMPGIPLDIIIFMYIDIHKKIDENYKFSIGERSSPESGESREFPGNSPGICN